MVNSIGSTWKRWDLHIHTPSSVLNMQYKFDHEEDREKYKGEIWDKYIDELESADPAISAIGITDYCSIDGYEKVMEYRNEGRLSNIDLILANVEFRILPITDKRKAINVHCIFSNELSVQDIRRFLDEVKYEYSGSKYKCNRNDLVELGKRYKPELTSDEEFYKEGVNQFKVSISDLKNVIEKDMRYKGRVFIVASNSSSDGISGLKDNGIATTRQELYRSVDFIFSGNGNDHKYFLGHGVDSKEEVVRICGSLKACLHGSDAHDFIKLFKPDMDRFCWIKGDSTFAGLRQLLFEPDARLKIQKEEPDSKKNIYSLKKIKMDSTNINQELAFQSVEIELNKNLISVIGGKGSGKTAVLDLIANCYKEYDRSRHYDSKGKATNGENEDQNSFVQRIEKECPHLEIYLDYLDDQSSFSKKVTDNSFFTDGQIRYLPQGKIEEVAGNTKAMHKDIQQLIFSHIEKRNDGEYQHYLGVNDDIKKVNSEISTLLGEINTLIAETASDILEGLNRQLEIKKGEYKDKISRLAGFDGTLTEEEKNTALTATEKLRDLDRDYGKAKEFIGNSEVIVGQLTDFQTDTNVNISNLSQDYPFLTMETVPQINFDNIIAAINKNKAYATIRKQDIEEQREKYAIDIETFTGLQNEQATLLREKDSIENSIKEINEKITEFEKKQKGLGSKVKDLNDKYEELLLKYKSQKNSYDRIIEKYKSLDEEILRNIDFKAEIRFDNTRLVELADDLFDKRKLADDFLEKCRCSIVDFLLNDKPLLLITDNSVSDFLRKNKTVFDYLKWLTADYCQLDTQVYFNGVELSKLSVGQKGAVILKLYLADGDYPIILDQPEDNLDNKFISEELLSTFRKAKEKRQIIIATHNANLVVNSDAEQIIVADFYENKIRYRAGSIENETIRKEVASLLEGGEEAFKQRESKYGFSDLT